MNANLPVSVSIAADPGSTVCAGTSVTFTATPVNGGTTPIYQWYNGVTAINGATSSTYTTVPVQGDAIHVVMTSDITPCATGNPATSNEITMTVNANVPVSVTIAANPGNTVCAGTSVTFTATPVNGGTTPTYQWYNGVTAINGETGSTYTTVPVQGDAISVVMTSDISPCATGNPATSNTITMTVNANLPVSVSIAADPGSTVCAGTSVTFTATPVNGGTTPIYQWYNGVTAINGATSSTYTTVPVQGDAIHVVMTSDITPCATGNPATSNEITMTVNANLPVSVSIAADPGNTVCAGTSVTFTATPVNGGTTPTYQWYNGVTAINGATGSTYTTVPVQGDAINVVMTSDITPCATGNPATSNAITMTVNANVPVSVTIAADPGNTVCAGTSVTFTATPVNGGTTPTYQWYNGVTAINGATGSTYTTTTLVNGDAISVVMTSDITPCATGNPATSNTITMTVNANVPVSVSIAADPGSTVCAGTSVTFTATPVNGGTTPIYQWYNGVTAINGATSSTYTTVPVQGDAIHVVMTSDITPCATGNPATSNEITMTVNANVPVSVTIAANPGNTVCAGTSVTFTATPVNGGTTPTYQWYNGVTAINGETGSTYTTVPVQGDAISVVMTSDITPCATGNPATSNAITMTVNANRSCQCNDSSRSG